MAEWWRLVSTTWTSSEYWIWQSKFDFKNLARGVTVLAIMFSAVGWEKRRESSFPSRLETSLIEWIFRIRCDFIFCNIKPFEIKIHVCVFLNCTILLIALGILGFLNFLSMTSLFWKPTAEEMLCLYSCFPYSGASSQFPCAASTVSRKLWKRTVCYYASLSRYFSWLSVLHLCTPEWLGVFGQLAASLFFPDFSTIFSVPEWRLK